MKHIFLFVLIISTLMGCSGAGKNQDSQEDEVYWSLIERAWEMDMDLEKEREVAIRKFH